MTAVEEYLLRQAQIHREEQTRCEVMHAVEREQRRIGWIVTLVSFLSCFPLAWLVSRLFS